MTDKAEEYRESWRKWKPDTTTPFSDRELEFMHLALEKLQKFIDSDEPREDHKPILQRNVDSIKTHISSSSIVFPKPSFQGRFFWDEFRRDKPPKDNEHALTTTLSLLFRGDKRLSVENGFKEKVDSFNLKGHD